MKRTLLKAMIFMFSASVFAESGKVSWLDKVHRTFKRVYTPGLEGERILNDGDRWIPVYSSSSKASIYNIQPYTHWNLERNDGPLGGFQYQIDGSKILSTEERKCFAQQLDEVKKAFDRIEFRSAVKDLAITKFEINVASARPFKMTQIQKIIQTDPETRQWINKKVDELRAVNSAVDPLIIRHRLEDGLARDVKRATDYDIDHMGVLSSAEDRLLSRERRTPVLYLKLDAKFLPGSDHACSTRSAAQLTQDIRGVVEWRNSARKRNSDPHESDKYAEHTGSAPPSP